jgi:hypothetical protein
MNTFCCRSPKKRSASWRACSGIWARCRAPCRTPAGQGERDRRKGKWKGIWNRRRSSCLECREQVRKQKDITRLIVATSIGNALEWYDIAVYGYFAVYISKAFFPSNDPTTSLLLTFGTFGAEERQFD